MNNDDKKLLDSPNTDGEAGDNDSLTRSMKKDYLYDIEAHDEYIVDFDSYEAMLISRTYDAVSRETKSGITDGSVATIYLERAGRVVGQLPSGDVQAAGKKDAGKGALLDIIRQKYIYPNANAQRPFLEKIRQWQMYSSVYGYSPMFVDWHVAATGYIGPDCWLWNPRNFIPQNGRSSIADMDYVHAISYVGIPYLESLLDEEDSDWLEDNVQKLIQDAAENTEYNDVRRDTLIKRTRQFQETRGLIPIVTRYEAGHCANCEDGDDDADHSGHWVTFCPKFGYRLLRDIPNPHKSGRIPFFIKPCIPLSDSFYGLGDFQRGRPLQFAKDGLTNFYFEGLKMNIYPPTVINANGVVKHSIDQRPGSIWQETIPNSVRRLETSTAGLSTYQAAITQLQSALQSQAGTTDTSVSMGDSTDPQVGKTPQALAMLNKRESTRDNIDRFYLESTLEDMIDYMLQLYITMGTETTVLDLFTQEIQEIIASGYADIIEGLDINRTTVKGKDGQPDQEVATSGKIKIKPSAFKDLVIKFQLNPGTTAAEDNEAKKEALDDWFGIINKMPNELESIRNQGKEINWQLAFDMYGQYSGVPELAKLWQDVTPQEQQQELQQMQSESIEPDTPHVDFRMMGNMDPQQVAGVMGSEGIGNGQAGAPQAPNGQPVGPQPQPQAMQQQQSPQQVPGPQMAPPQQQQPQAMPQASQPNIAPPHPLNSSDPAIRAAAQRIQQMTQQRR